MSVCTVLFVFIIVTLSNAYGPYHALAFLVVLIWLALAKGCEMEK